MQYRDRGKHMSYVMVDFFTSDRKMAIITGNEKAKLFEQQLEFYNPHFIKDSSYDFKFHGGYTIYRVGEYRVLNIKRRLSNTFLFCHHKKYFNYTALCKPIFIGEENSPGKILSSWVKSMQNNGPQTNFGFHFTYDKYSMKMADYCTL